MAELAPSIREDVLDALSGGLVPEEFWNHQDDACDCYFQRIGLWKNPYLGKTLEVRMCCIWAELYKLFPDKVRMVDAYQDEDTGQWVQGVIEWDGEDDMPKPIWYRQMAVKDGITVEEARRKYRDRDDERPRGVEKEPQPIYLTSTQMLAMENLQSQMAMIQQRMATVLEEAGLDKTKVYNISPDGLVTEVEDAQEDV